jgi:uncharacterized surface protein with fasciclin (FAS1) repeats
MIENFQQKLLLATKQKLINQQRTEMSLTDILSVLNEPDLLTLLTQDFSNISNQEKISFTSELIHFNTFLSKNFKSNFLTPSFTEKDFIETLIFNPEAYRLLTKEGKIVDFKLFLMNYVNNLNETERKELFSKIVSEKIDSSLIPFIFIPTKEEVLFLFSNINSIISVDDYLKDDFKYPLNIEYLTKLTNFNPIKLSDLAQLTEEELKKYNFNYTTLPIQFNASELGDFLNQNNGSPLFNKIVEKVSIDSLELVKESFSSLTNDTKQHLLTYLIETKIDIFSSLTEEIIESFNLLKTSLQQQFLSWLNTSKRYNLLDDFIKPEHFKLLDNGFYKTMKQAGLSLESKDKEKLVSLFEKDISSLTFLYQNKIITIDTLFDKLPVNDNTANFIAILINEKIDAKESTIDYFKAAYNRGFLFSDPKHLSYLIEKVDYFVSIEDKKLLLALLDYHFIKNTDKKNKYNISSISNKVAFELGKQEGHFSVLNSLAEKFKDYFFKTISLKSEMSEMVNALNPGNKQLIKQYTVESLKNNQKDIDVFLQDNKILDLFSKEELMSFINIQEYEPYFDILVAKGNNEPDEKRKLLLDIFFNNLDINFYKKYSLKKEAFFLETTAFFNYSKENSLTKEQLYAFLSCYGFDKDVPLAPNTNYNPNYYIIIESIPELNESLISLLEIRELTYLMSLKKDINPELLNSIPLDKRKELFLSLLKSDNAQYLFDLLSININHFTNTNKMELFLTIFNLKDEKLFLFLKENGITVNFDELTANEKVILLAESQDYFNYFVENLERKFKEKDKYNIKEIYDEDTDSDEELLKEHLQKKGFGFFFKNFFGFRKSKTELLVTETKTLLLNQEMDIKEKEPLKYFLKVRTVPVKSEGAFECFKSDIAIAGYFRPLLSDRITNKLDSIENHIVYLLNGENQHFLDDGEKFFLLDSAKNLTFNVIRNYLASPIMLSTFGVEQQEMGDKVYCEQLELIEKGLSSIMKNQQKRVKENMLSETAVLKALSDNFLKDKGDKIVIKN